MDDISAAIANYAAGFQADEMSRQATDVLLSHILDALGCGIAAVDERPCIIVRDFAETASVGKGGASVIGLSEKVLPEFAALANAAAVRVLDYNDTYSGKSGGHPTDMVAGILAAAEVAGASGARALSGVFIAFEVFAALADAVALRDFGFDQGAFVAVATAAGAAHVSGLDKNKTAHAVSLAVTTSVPLRVARSGELSEWKGCATAHSVMNAVLCTRLAQAGMQGPPRPFRGVDGFEQRVAGPLALERIGVPRGGLSAVERTGIKFLPVEWCAQAPAELFLSLHGRIAPEEIEAIHIVAYDFLFKEIGGGRNDAAEKWNPQTRETADHSLPYVIAVALTDGAVTLDSFLPLRFLDPALRPLMNKISVSHDPQKSELYPERQLLDVRITLKSGEVLDRQCEFAKGHPGNPCTVEEIAEKFMRLAARVLSAPRAQDIQAEVQRLPHADSVEGLMARLREVPTEHGAREDVVR